ncbi:MAG: YtxH domain-containing protein [Microbacterium sp.]|uniref:YtxH domain-containing protein n=1 Tax=Microbacterium sp. TaxID=51671 RepID=UPI003A86CDB8
MRGKVGLVIGLGIGYVLGTRAGRERYEQIKAQAIKLWELDPVQQRVGQVTDFAKSTAMAVPTALWNTATKAVKAASDSADAPKAPAKPAAKPSTKTDESG